MTDPTENLPPPLVPAEVDLRDFQYMELDVLRLRDSRFVSEVKPEAFRAGVMLWCAAWHQVPAGSLPNNPIELAKLAGYGFAVKEWTKVSRQALTKFVLCNDGRLYHEEVSIKALSAWRSRLEHFYDRACDRARKVNKARGLESPARPPLPILSFDEWNARRISDGIPMEKADAAAGIPVETPVPSAGIPVENALKGEGEGTERESEHARARTRENPPIPPESPPTPVSPTLAGTACLAMRQAGLQSANPSDPRLLALLAQGATVAEFAGIAAEAVDKRRGWAWVLSVVEKRRADAASIALAPATAPPPSRAAAESAAYLADLRHQTEAAQTPESIRAREEFARRHAKRRTA